VIENEYTNRGARERNRKNRPFMLNAGKASFLLTKNTISHPIKGK